MKFPARFISLFQTSLSRIVEIYTVAIDSVCHFETISYLPPSASLSCRCTREATEQHAPRTARTSLSRRTRRPGSSQRPFGLSCSLTTARRCPRVLYLSLFICLSLPLPFSLSIRTTVAKRSSRLSLAPSARGRRLAVITRTRLCNQRLVTANRRLFPRVALRRDDFLRFTFKTGTSQLPRDSSSANVSEKGNLQSAI